MYLDEKYEKIKSILKNIEGIKVFKQFSEDIKKEIELMDPAAKTLNKYISELEKIDARLGNEIKIKKPKLESLTNKYTSLKKQVGENTLKLAAFSEFLNENINMTDLVVTKSIINKSHITEIEKRSSEAEIQVAKEKMKDESHEKRKLIYTEYKNEENKSDNLLKKEYTKSKKLKELESENIVSKSEEEVIGSINIKNKELINIDRETYLQSMMSKSLEEKNNNQKDAINEKCEQLNFFQYALISDFVEREPSKIAEFIGKGLEEEGFELANKTIII